MNTSEKAAQNELLESMLGDFLDESGQLLERLNANLLQLDAEVRSRPPEQEACCDDALLNEMFRSAHSLKGLSAMLGLGDINNLTHRLENVFDAARKDGLTVTGDVVELMFQAVDHLEKLVESLKDPTAAPVECEPIIEGIHRLLESNGVERRQSSQSDAEKALVDCPAATDVAASATVAPDCQPPAPEKIAALDDTVAAECAAASSPPRDAFAGVEDEAVISDKYVPIFIDEAGLALERLSETLLNYENGESSASLKTLLHTAHQIKGSAASVGLNRVAKMAHLMEDLLQNLVDSHDPLAPQAADAMLKCTDGLRQYLENLKRGQRKHDSFSQLAAELLVAQSAAAPSAEKIPLCLSRPDVAEAFRRCVEAAAPEGMPALVGQVRFEAQLAFAGLKAQLVHERLANLGEIYYFDPPLEQLDELEVLEHLCFGIATERPAEIIRDQLRIAGIAELLIEPLPGETSALPNAAPVSPASGPGVSTVRSGDAAKSVTPSTGTVAGKAVSPHPNGESARPKGPVADAAGTPTETLRVEIERLDELMNLSGQLVISKARFAQFGDRLKALRCSKRWNQSLVRVLAGLGQLGGGIAAGGDNRSQAAELGKLQSQARRLQTELETMHGEMQVLEGLNESMNNLYDAIHQLDRVSDGIQKAVMDTRMIPIGPLFNRFKRVIRDITRANGKNIGLVINGEKTKLDKRMIDELGDPLIHMVRNSADHGIELPEDREAAGKPRQGTITLDAFHRGNYVVIQVRDDGAGLNVERILQKCLEKGLLSEAEAQRMTPHQIHQMIWAPGLSTAEKVTEVSGRGMGMDIVKAKIELLHGTVELESTPGQGTLLSIKLPLTLAILPSLLVDIDGDVFAMPMESVIEIVRVARDQLTTVHGRRTAWVRKRAISVVELEHVLRWTGGKACDHSGVADDATIVVIGESNSELGLAVDSVLGEQDVVIKAITENYRNVAGITGASILGDGRVSLILDIAALIQMATDRAAVATLSGKPT